MGWSAFAPKGNTAALDVTNVTTVTPIQVLGSPGEGENNNYLVSNSTSQGCFLAFGKRTNITAAIPVMGTSQNSIWLPGNSVQTFTFDSESYFAAITPTGVTTLYITPGDGL